MPLFIYIVTPLLLLIFLIGLIAYYLRRTRWPATKKKLYFTLIASFLFFPVLVPAATIAGIPMPNSLFLGLTIFYGGVTEIAGWYIATWLFSLPSFLITALIFRGVAAMIFYERKQT